MTDLSLDDAEHVSLCEALDRILNKGAVVTGDLTISVADIDLIYVGLRILISSAGALRAPQEGGI
jgi:gas vesicle structural protein